MFWKAEKSLATSGNRTRITCSQQKLGTLPTKLSQAKNNFEEFLNPEHTLVRSICSHSHTYWNVSRTALL
jgi:hypothetical protein